MIDHLAECSVFSIFCPLSVCGLLFQRQRSLAFEIQCAIQMSERALCKVVFLGDSGVGKTSIVSRWANSVFHEESRPTVGARHDRRVVTVDSGDIELSVWDTAGQEQFQALIPLYARGASGAILVASVVDRTSFDTLPTWIDVLKTDCVAVPPLILAVNKMDLGDPVMTADEIEATYPMFSSIFYVSAKTGQSIDNLFLQVAADAAQFMQEKQSKNAALIPADRDEKGGCC
jgi:small GTP-binding protein